MRGLIAANRLAFIRLIGSRGEEPRKLLLASGRIQLQHCRIQFDWGDTDHSIIIGPRNVADHQILADDFHAIPQFDDTKHVHRPDPFVSIVNLVERSVATTSLTFSGDPGRGSLTKVL